MIPQFCFCIAVCDILTQNMSCERFFIISTFSKAIENFRLHFLKISYKRKFFFLTHFLYLKSTFNSDRKLYKKKWCDQMRTWSNSHWKNWFTIWLSQITVAERLIDSHRLLSRKKREKRIDKLLQIAIAKTFCWERESSYSISKAAQNWTNLSLINDFVRSSIIIWSIDT